MKNHTLILLAGLSALVSNACPIFNFPFLQACPPLKQCYVPASSDILFSNNKPWWE